MVMELKEDLVEDKYTKLAVKEDVKESVREYIKDIKEMNSEDSSTETKYEQSTFFKQETAKQITKKGIDTLEAVNNTEKKLESLDIKIEEKETSALAIYLANAAAASKEQSNKFQDKVEKKKKNKSIAISMRKKLMEKMKVIDELDRNYAVKKLKETKIFKKLYKEIVSFTANPELVKVPGSYKALIKIVNRNDIYERMEAILSFKYMVDSGTVNVFMDDEEIYMIGGYLSSMTYKKAYRLTKIILYTIINKMQIKDISKFERRS